MHLGPHSAQLVVNVKKSLRKQNNMKSDRLIIGYLAAILFYSDLLDVFYTPYTLLLLNSSVSVVNSD